MDWTRRRVVVATAGGAVLAGCLGEDGPGDVGGDDSASEADGAGEPDESNETDESESDESETGDEDADADDSAEDAEAALEDADLEDHTGEETVPIAVDPDEGFDPEALEIDQDTVLEWTWEGTSTGVYPLETPPECIWEEEVDAESVDEREAGDEFDRLFWAPGAYLYASRDEDGEEFTGAFRVLESEDDGEDGNDGSDGSDGNE